MSISGLIHTQLNDYFEHGYLRIPQIVPAELLEKLRALFEELMADENETGKVSYLKNGRRFVTNLDDLTPKGNLACLELLGLPAVLEIAETLCGADFFSIQEFGVIKELGSDSRVLWHQDMLHARTGNCFTMGIYLDDADKDDGALRVVPVSHLTGKNICELQNEPFIQLPVKAGDVQIHDMMLAHASEPLHRNKIRRVIYFEFLPVAQVRGEELYPAETVKVRRELLRTAIAFYRRQNPQAPIYKGFEGQFENLEPIEDFEKKLNEIYSVRVRPHPSAYCFEHFPERSE